MSSGAESTMVFPSKVILLNEPKLVTLFEEENG